MSEKAADLGRRELLAYSAAVGSAFLAAPTLMAADGDGSGSAPPPGGAARKRYAMKKSINLWAFPYPDRMSLEQCLQLAKDAGFDGIELNYDLDNDLSTKSGKREYEAIRKTADRIGIAISGLCSFLFWPYPLLVSS